MYHYKTVLQGLSKFVDEDLVPKMSGLQRWIFGTGAGIVLNKGDEMFRQYKDIPILHTLSLVEDEKINVTCIYHELLSQADKGPIHIDVPMLGTITLDKSDVEKIYRYIID